MRVHVTLKSANAKTGPIPVSTTSAESCPDTCPFQGSGCYADAGPLALHWRKVTSGERGMQWGEFCNLVRTLPHGAIWRHNQAGDLPHNTGIINAAKLATLVDANKGKKGFTYTHHDPVTNADAIRNANREGFTVNLSANNLEHADALVRQNIAPVTVVLPADHTAKVTYTPGGIKVVTCPAETSKGITCQRCQLCADPARYYVIGFPAHGTSKRKASIIAEG